MYRASLYKRVGVAGIFLILMGWIGHSVLSAKSVSPQESKTKKESVIPAKALYDEFKKDSEAATKKYAGITLTVQGFVVYTGPDVYVLPSVELLEKKGGKSRSLCVLPFSDYLKLHKVSKGEVVKMKGEVCGFY